MTSIITGDIINSRKSASKAWLKVLKTELTRRGDTPRQWEIFRGDSFQIEIKKPAEALMVAIKIKAALKTIRGVDVRMSIGLGEKSYNAKSITESNGSAFVHSGELVEQLKKDKRNLAVRSSNAKFDYEMNLYLKLASITMDAWTTNAADTMQKALEYPGKSQEALGKLLKIKQNAVSTRLKRACYYEIVELIEMYENKVGELK